MSVGCFMLGKNVRSPSQTASLACCLDGASIDQTLCDQLICLPEPRDSSVLTSPALYKQAGKETRREAKVVLEFVSCVKLVAFPQHCSNPFLTDKYVCVSLFVCVRMRVCVYLGWRCCLKVPLMSLQPLEHLRKGKPGRNLYVTNH